MTVKMDEQQKPILPDWATLTQVSEALAILRSAVRSAARRALKRQEAWVKKEAGVILLDTQHKQYPCHATRGKDAMPIFV